MNKEHDRERIVLLITLSTLLKRLGYLLSIFIDVKLSLYQVYSDSVFGTSSLA